MTRVARHIAPRELCILIADDDEGDRKQLKRVLKQAGLSCECIEAVSIEEALAACDRTDFDCAIVDYQMPGRDGLEGVAALRERLPFLSIIMATGHGDETIATEAMKRGASDYIAKTHIEAKSIRRSVESALEKATLRRKVAQQREELETFASVLVHDLSAPIASLQLFARAIEEDLLGEEIDRDEIIDHCRQVVSAGRRTSALIDTLYEYTRADAPVAFEPIEMQQVMDSALLNLNRVIVERRARVSHGELPLVTGNAPQLVQLMQNLIGNAIKYCKADPPCVHVSATADLGDAWLFAVTDNGIGIPEADRGRVFEPFKRLRGAGEYEGTGLGLAICSKVVGRHGGVIRCEANEVGEGTTFLFTLPGALAIH